MIRSILGFALFAVAVWLVLKIVLGILGTLIGLAITILVLAGVGYVCYLVLQLFSPGTAAKVRDAIRGRPRTSRSAADTPVRPEVRRRLVTTGAVVVALVAAPYVLLPLFSRCGFYT